jgi:GrpB-like predicted nucleotidyltransferase (UPF0157 family)
MSDGAGIEWFDQPGGDPVELSLPSPLWLALAEEWSGALLDVLNAIEPRVEHIGSTAVPGLLAKPVVDLQVSVPDVDDEGTYRAALESLGFVLRAREPGHRFFRPPAGQPRIVHVHVCQKGSDWERDHLLFRDQLRARPDLAARYAELKRRLAREKGTDRIGYTEGKAEFIRDVLRSAG